MHTYLLHKPSAILRNITQYCVVSSGYGSSKTVKSQNKGQSLLMSEAASIKADVCPSCEELKDKLKLSKDMVQRLEVGCM